MFGRGVGVAGPVHEAGGRLALQLHGAAAPRARPPRPLLPRTGRRSSAIIHLLQVLELFINIRSRSNNVITENRYNRSSRVRPLGGSTSSSAGGAGQGAGPGAYLQQRLQLVRLLVPQVEQAVPRVVRVQAEPRAVLAEPAARAHHERLAAAVAELVLALRAREVHAAAPLTKCLEYYRAWVDPLFSVDVLSRRET